MTEESHTSEYFSQHLGEYENVLAALEDLNLSILKAMGKTKKDYQEASNLEQFVTRFLLKETLNQLQSLQNSLECAMETTEEQTRQERQLVQGPAKPEVLSIQWPGKRSSRRVQRHNSFSPNSPQFNVSSPALLEEDNQWITQINRLQKLIDRLEKKDLKLEPLEEEVIEESTKPHIMLVQRQMSVTEDDLEEFQLALKHYVESASAQSGCLRISIQKLANESRYMIYEFWENSSVWNRHLQTNYSKTFQRSNVDFLETPELTSTMLVPAGQRESGQARSPQGVRCLRSPCPLAPQCPPPTQRRPPLTYRLKTREGFRHGVAALSPDTAATAERPAAVGERLPPRVASRLKSAAQRAGGGVRAGRAPGPGPLNRRHAAGQGLGAARDRCAQGERRPRAGAGRRRGEPAWSPGDAVCAARSPRVGARPPLQPSWL
ncbi:N-terminal EF-hand calcium-binding protein 1 [Microtus ochrogaster]|uniref:N-terminal EF-hand calcium-binding protein 1 n=1 Tax=Microtus ochrogaster TaxID=79684 RepID=A0A8J6KXH6_MICOH|nr:N-terminal EF-hand calcium-binding protein 1 [Microtus ochrogaster]